MPKKTGTALAAPAKVAEPMRIERGTAPLSRFKPWPGNPRTHPPEEISLLALILTQYGPDQDIVVDEDWWILKGHGRLESAQLAKMKEFPFTQRFGLSDADKRAIRIHDNQIALTAGWDMAKLRADAAALKADGYDLKMLGFGGQMTGWLTAGELVSDPAAEWTGMPHFNNPDARAFRSIVVHFNKQEDIDAFAKATSQVITEKTRFLWYPEIIIKPFVKYTGGGKPKPKKAAAKEKTR